MNRFSWFRHDDGAPAGAGRFPPMSLQPVDEARWVVRPPGIVFYAEAQYDEYGVEQLRLHEAEGEERAAKYVRKARMTEPGAAQVMRDIEAHEELVRGLEKQAVEAARVLSPFVRRPGWERPRYWVTMPVLLACDAVAVAGASIWLGEPVSFAAVQGVGTGLAVVTAGLLGREIADSRRARRQQQNPRRLNRDLRRYPHLFSGPDPGESLVKPIVYGALAVGAAVACSVFGLRTATEGVLAGVVFGTLALAVSLASFANTYVYSDEVADLIDRAKTAVKKQKCAGRRLSRNRTLRRHLAALASAESIRLVWRKRGEAAAAAVRAEKYRQLSLHPGVAGHGYPTTPPPAAPPADADPEQPS